MSCQICFNEYNHSSHKPYSLSNCPHTFCVDCLNKLKTNKCPNCNANIITKNPNLSLLEFIPKGSYDKSRDELEILLNQVNSLNKGLASDVEKKHKENALQIEEIKKQIRTKGDELVKLINTSVAQLDKELEYHEATLKYSVDNLNCNPIDSADYIITKSLFDANKLNEAQMKEKISRFQSIKTDLNNSVLEASKYKDKIQFVSNDNIDIGCFGQIKEDESKNVDFYRKMASHFWFINKEHCLFLLKKAINLNPTKQQLDFICIDLQYKHRREPNILNEILECFDLAIKVQPLNSKAHFYKAETLKEHNKLPEALESYTKAINLEPKNKEYKAAKRSAVKISATEKKRSSILNIENVENIEPNSKKQKV